MSLKRLKLADEKTKCIIFGYSRENMQQFSINLPTMIQYLFLMYYWIQEIFTEYGDDIELDTNHQNLIRFTAGSYWYNTAYGNNDTIDINDISIARYIWSFRYVNLGGICLQFGISSTRCKNIQLSKNQGIYYCYGTNGAVYSHYGNKAVSCYDDEEGIIHLILDVLEDKLLMSRNNENKEYVVADNIDLKNNKYNMAVSGEVKDGEEIELISFKIVQR